MAWQDSRRGQNEAVFRAINERIEDFGADHADDVIDFVCECSELDCGKIISLTRRTYEHVRATPTRFIVALGHEQSDIEDVVERHDHINVVEKRGEAGALAERTDPRG